MKKIITLALILLTVFTFSSCLKEDHQIRFRNNYPEAILDAQAGSANFGNVGFGGMSSYQKINVGDFTISGRTAKGQQLTGSGSVKGKGKHKWTLTLNNGGTVSISEDK